MHEFHGDAESLKSLYAAMASAQAEMPHLQKDQTAEIPTKKGGRFSYGYMGLPAMLEAVRPVLSKHSLALWQFPATDQNRLKLTTVLSHKDGGRAENTLECMTGTDPQSIGSAITYLRRYSLMALAGICPDDDDDGAAGVRGAESAPRQQTGQPVRSDPSPQEPPPKQYDWIGTLHGRLREKVGCETDEDMEAVIWWATAGGATAEKCRQSHETAKLVMERLGELKQAAETSGGAKGCPVEFMLQKARDAYAGAGEQQQELARG